MGKLLIVVGVLVAFAGLAAEAYVTLGNVIDVF